MLLFLCLFTDLVDNRNEDPSEQNADEEMIEIGNGIHAKKSIVDDIKSDYRYQPGMFLRKLMFKTKIFTLEEVAECSLTGQKHKDGSQRPALDPNKFLACKSKNLLSFCVF